MNINRHNYEEYFILYMDNELSSNDRRQVEAFVQKHPDLKDELDSLLQYKLVPDTTIVFDAKEELMKVNGETPISVSNYEEWLVLYIDNELTSEQKTTVEQFIAANPSLTEEFDLLQRARLQPEKIVFAAKASLYRREEKVKALPVRWWRIAAAAVLLLGIGITTAIVVNNRSNNDKGEIVKGTSGEKINPIILPVINNKEENAPLTADNVKQFFSPDPKQTAIANSAVKEKKAIVKNQLPVNVPQQKEEAVVVIKKPSNDLPESINNRNINKTDVTNAIADNVSKEINKQQGPLTNSVVTRKDPQPSESIRTASYNADDADLDQSSKKSKLRGFFRKVARTFEKRTDIDPTDDDNKLLVAGLSFKLK